jgi:AP endonuclease 2
MRIVTWNVNGLRAVTVAKGIRHILSSTKADILCVQETKLTRDKITEDLALVPGWDSFFDFSQLKTGYSGVATFCKEWCSPQAAYQGVVGPCTGYVTHLTMKQRGSLDSEGRCVMTDHGAFVLFNVYVPALSCEEQLEVCLCPHTPTAHVSDHATPLGALEHAPCNTTESHCIWR